MGGRQSINVPTFLQKHVSLFQDMSEESLQGLATGSCITGFEANEAIAHCGDDVSHLSVILSGAVSASAIGDSGTRQVLGRLESGGTFGELALMTGDKLLADLIAETPCQVLRIPVSIVQATIMSNPAGMKRLCQT